MSPTNEHVIDRLYHAVERVQGGRNARILVMEQHGDMLQRRLRELRYEELDGYVELERRHTFTHVKGLAFGILLSLPFWLACAAYLWWPRVMITVLQWR